jgi:hypothetical protein
MKFCNSGIVLKKIRPDLKMTAQINITRLNFYFLEKTFPSLSHLF